MISSTRGSRLKILYFTRSRVVLMKNRSPSQKKKLGDRWGLPSRFTPATMTLRGSARKSVREDMAARYLAAAAFTPAAGSATRIATPAALGNSPDDLNRPEGCDAP